MEQPRPRIGVTMGGRDERRYQRYLQYVRHAGGDPVLVRPGADTRIESLDGLLLSGGVDVAPAAYGQAADPDAYVVVDPERDGFELPLAQRALEAGMPVLGICRGFQVLNVLHGGTLVQHLDGHRRGEGSETPSGQHPVRVDPDSRLGRMVGERVAVNSRHHQAVRAGNLARGLRPTAWSDDGLIEGLERDDGGWVVGVQWHPERADECDPVCAEIARGLVAAALAARQGTRR